MPKFRVTLLTSLVEWEVDAENGHEAIKEGWNRLDNRIHLEGEPHTMVAEEIEEEEEGP